MKASFYTESILYWLARGLSSAVQRIPPPWGVAFGSAVGTLVYHCLSGRRAVALSNLRAAFGDSYTPREYRQILKAQFQHLGMTLIEVAMIPRIDRAYVDRWITITPESRQRLERELAEGRGVIFLAGHFGNWELIPITGALHGFPTMVLAREQGWPRLNRLLTQYRESKGCGIITKGFPIREMIRGLREGRIVGIVADQDGGSNGVLAPFFGRRASTAPGAIALSIETGAPVLPVVIVRRAGPAHTLIVGEPLEIPSEGALDERVQAGIAAYLRTLEPYIRKHPHQWLWLHRRWKSSPERRLLIVSDGRAGHLTQARAFAQRIKEAWQIRQQNDKRLRGVQKGLVSIKTVQVNYRNRFWRGVLSTVAGLAPRRYGGGDFWLRVGLAPESYRAIRSAHADISISCGAAAAPVNLLWAWGIRAKSVQILQSRWPSWRRFDLAVIPRHDSHAPHAFPNLLVIDGALAPEQKPIPDQLENWRRALNITRPRRIGLLLGGAARGIALDPQQVKKTVEGLVSAAKEMDADLLVTSSRRTTPEVEEILHHILGKEPCCRLMVLVNRQITGGLNSTQEAIPCIFGLADLLVVSGDSISMVSEAVQRGTPVVSFLPTKTGWSFGPPKHHRFLEQLDKQGAIRLAEPEDIGEVVTQLMGDGVRASASFPRNDGQSDPIVERLVKWL